MPTACRILVSLNLNNNSFSSFASAPPPPRYGREPGFRHDFCWFGMIFFLKKAGIGISRFCSELNAQLNTHIVVFSLSLSRSCLCSHCLQGQKNICSRCLREEKCYPSCLQKQTVFGYCSNKQQRCLGNKPQRSAVISNNGL